MVSCPALRTQVRGHLKSLMRLIFACFLLLFPYFAAAQAPAPADATLPASHATAIANALKALPKQRSLSAEDRKQAEDLLNQAQADETQADDLAHQWQSLRETADCADDAAAKIDAALAQDDSDALDAWKKNLPAHASTDQLETMLATERSSLTAAHSAVTALDAEMRHQSARPAQIRDELTAAYASVDSAQGSRRTRAIRAARHRTHVARASRRTSGDGADRAAGTGEPQLRAAHALAVVATAPTSAHDRRIERARLHARIDGAQSHRRICRDTAHARHAAGRADSRRTRTCSPTRRTPTSR